MRSHHPIICCSCRCINYCEGCSLRCPHRTDCRKFVCDCVQRRTRIIALPTSSPTKCPTAPRGCPDESKVQRCLSAEPEIVCDHPCGDHPFHDGRAECCRSGTAFPCARTLPQIIIIIIINAFACGAAATASCLRTGWSYDTNFALHVSTAFAAKAPPLPCVFPLPSRQRHCLCLKTAHLPCGSTAFAAKTLPLPCVFCGSDNGFALAVPLPSQLSVLGCP